MDPIKVEVEPVTQPSGDTPQDVKVSVTADPDADSYAKFPSKEVFDERVNRSTSAKLRRKIEEWGVKNEDELKERLQRLAHLEKAEEEARRAQMSEIEQERAKRTEAEERVRIERERAQDATFNFNALNLARQHGIRDWEYLRYRMLNELDKLPDDGELDEQAFVQQLLADPGARAALGADPLPAETPEVVELAQTSPIVNTRPGIAGGVPAQPAPANGASTKSVMEMDRAEWAQYCAAHNISI